MVKSIYVGNLPWGSTEEEVRELFATYGEVHSVKIIEDRETGRSRGFGFVEMSSNEAENAIENLQEASLDGRPLRINEARPRQPRRW